MFIRKPRPPKINDQRITRNLIVDKEEYDIDFKYLYKKLCKKSEFPLSIIEVGEFSFNLIKEFRIFNKIFSIEKNQELQQVIYEHKSGFYIYIEKSHYNFIKMNLIYDQNERQEIDFFITRLKKIQHD